MLPNYIKTTLRNLRKHRTLAIINILGFSVGLTVVILIGISVAHELSYDRFHNNAENIYRIERTGKIKGREFHLPHTNHIIPKALYDEFPSITNFVRIWSAKGLFQDHHHNFHQEEIYLADPSFFDIFSFPLLRGDQESILKDPYSAVITKPLALKYFGSTDIVGQSMEAQIFDSSITLTIQGIMEEIPGNSHLQTPMVVSYETARSLTPASVINTWVGNYLYSYITVEEGTNIGQLTGQFPGFIRKYMDEEFRRIFGEEPDIREALQFHLQPLTGIFLYARLPYAIGPSGDINKVYTGIGIAFLILLIACINYINLSTAKSTTRAREVGLRKVFGADRRKVSLQFIGESVILALFGLLLSMIMVESILPAFNAFMGKELTIGYLEQPQILVILFGGALLVGILAGIYPALYMSAYRPGTILKNPDAAQKGKTTAGIRRGLVIVQFAISIVFFISLFTMNKQLNFMISKDLGFRQEKVMVIRSDDQVFQKSNHTLRQNLLQNPRIENIGFADSNLGETEYGDGVFQVKNGDPDSRANLSIIHVDDNFIPTLKIPLLAGRSFSRDMRSDLNGAYIINEKALKELGLSSPQQAVGTLLEESHLEGKTEGKIVGVIRNFHYQPLYREIKPLILSYRQQDLNHMFLKMPHTRNMNGTITSIQASITKKVPNFNPNYTFLEDQYRASYSKELQMKRLFTVFSLLAIFIATIGLFGLATFITERKTKEIGIRKALGASTAKIILKLSSQFLKWVLLSNLIAWPLAYWALENWLNHFAYRVELEAGYFLLSAIIALAIAQITIAYQAFTTARTNPVESLRYE